MKPLVARRNLLEHTSGACDWGDATLHHDSPCGRPMHTVLSPSQKDIFSIRTQRWHSSSCPDPETGASSKTQLFPVGSEEPGDVKTSMEDHFMTGLCQKSGGESGEGRVRKGE